MNETSSPRREREEAERRAVVMALPTIQARHHAQIRAAHEGDVRVRASVGPAGEAVVLWSTAADEPALTSRATGPGGATFPEPRTPRSVGARVTTHAPDTAVAVRIDQLPLAHPAVQPLPDGRVLVVGARCQWRPEGPDRNAIVYDSAGQMLTEKTLGDGIKHVFTTAAGEVWVGYFERASTATSAGANAVVRHRWGRAD